MLRRAKPANLVMAPDRITTSARRRGTGRGDSNCSLSEKLRDANPTCQRALTQLNPLAGFRPNEHRVRQKHTQSITGGKKQNGPRRPVFVQFLAEQKTIYKNQIASQSRTSISRPRGAGQGGSRSRLCWTAQVGWVALLAKHAVFSLSVLFS